MKTSSQNKSQVRANRLKFSWNKMNRWTINKLNTSNNAQFQGNKNKQNKTTEQRWTKITNENENKDKDDDNGKVSKITDTLSLVINILNTLKKSVRPPTKTSVKESTASDLTPTTTLTSAETTISTITQGNINKFIRMIIRDKTYLMVKVLENDNMTSRIIVLALDTKYIQKPIGWKRKDSVLVHMKKYMYRAYSQQVRHNSQLLLRKYYMGKNKIKTNWLREVITLILTNCFVMLFQ